MLTEEQREGLRLALTEATLLGFEVDPARRVAAATVAVLSLPERGPAPEDRRVQLLLQPVGRVAASLRNSRWDDPHAQAVPFALDELLSVVQSFGGLPVYGGELIDNHAAELARWGDRLSLDWSSGDDGRAHSLTVFQEAPERILDLCVWFDELAVRDPSETPIPLDAFIAGARRWWDGFGSGDERTRGSGLFPFS